MNVSDYTKLARKFRNAIENAVDSGELRSYPFYKFPRDCCDMTCDLLAQYLLEHQIETVQVNGIHESDSQWHHVWLQTMDGIVIDITADQFNKSKGMPNQISDIHVGDEGLVHKIFSNSRRYEENTTFVEELCDPFGIPNPRKEALSNAYEIVCRYL